MSCIGPQRPNDAYEAKQTYKQGLKAFDEVEYLGVNQWFVLSNRQVGRCNEVIIYTRI